MSGTHPFVPQDAHTADANGDVPGAWEGKGRPDKVSGTHLKQNAHTADANADGQRVEIAGVTNFKIVPQSLIR